MNSEVSKELPKLVMHKYQFKGEASHLNYLASIRDSAKSGLGYMGNRHLSCLVESIFVNVGGFYQEMSSPSVNDRSVGGVIVVGARESRVHGEGR